MPILTDWRTNWPLSRGHRHHRPDHLPCIAQGGLAGCGLCHFRSIVCLRGEKSGRAHRGDSNFRGRNLRQTVLSRADSNGRRPARSAESTCQQCRHERSRTVGAGNRSLGAEDHCRQFSGTFVADYLKRRALFTAPFSTLTVGRV